MTRATRFIVLLVWFLVLAGFVWIAYWLVESSMVGITKAAYAAAITDCPAAAPEGVYHLLGRDRSGSPVCVMEHYKACPYADAQAADSTVCAKLGK